jgi:hypothetical protein
MWIQSSQLYLYSPLIQQYQRAQNNSSLRFLISNSCSLIRIHRYISYNTHCLTLSHSLAQINPSKPREEKSWKETPKRDSESRTEPFLWRGGGCDICIISRRDLFCLLNSQKKEPVGEDDSVPEVAQDVEALTAETLSVWPHDTHTHWTTCADMCLVVLSVTLLNSPQRRQEDPYSFPLLTLKCLRRICIVRSDFWIMASANK